MVDTGTAKRGRKLTACERCRKRKIKCDKHRPCTNCTKKNLPCHGDIDIEEQYEKVIIKNKLKTYKSLEFYWKKQLEILMYIRENPVRSPFTNEIISPKIIHILFALLSLNPKLRYKIEKNEAQTSICLDAFQSNMNTIFSNFTTSFNLQLATHFWTLFTETKVLSSLDEECEMENEYEQELSVKIVKNLDTEDFLSILEYLIPFVRGCYVLGWKEIELKLFSLCRTMLKRIIFQNKSEKGLNKTNSERLLHCLLVMGNYHEAYNRYGSSSSCYVLSYNFVGQYCTRMYDPMVVTRIYCSLLWSAKTKNERDLWIKYSSSRVSSVYDIHPFSYLLSIILTELKLSGDDEETLYKCKEHINHAIHLLKTSESNNPPIYKDSCCIYLKLAKAEIHARMKQFNKSMKSIDKVHQKLEAMDDIRIPLLMKQIRKLLPIMFGLSYKYQREDGTWTTALNELEKRLSHILTPPSPSPEKAIEWMKMNQKYY